jgi:hypothetical protein
LHEASGDGCGGCKLTDMSPAQYHRLNDEFLSVFNTGHRLLPQISALRYPAEGTLGADVSRLEHETIVGLVSEPPIARLRHCPTALMNFCGELDPNKLTFERQRKVYECSHDNHGVSQRTMSW